MVSRYVKPMYQMIAVALQARQRCIAEGNSMWEEEWERRLFTIETYFLPNGSGFDGGTLIDRDKHDSATFYLTTHFHHMNGYGMYTKWTSHRIKVTADLVSTFTLSVGGRNHNEIKDYIVDVFSALLEQEMEVIENGDVIWKREAA